MSKMLEAERQGLLLKGPVLKGLLIFSLPLLVGNLLQQMYNIVDTIVVGRFVGGNALAAVGASANISFMLIGFFMGLTTGAGVVLAQYFGAGDERRVGDTVHTAMALSLILGVIITVAGLWTSEWLLLATDTPPEVMDDALLYLRIIYAGILPILLYNMGAGLLRAVGDSKTPIYHLAVATAVNIVLDVLLVAVIPLEVTGAALATVLAQLVAAILTLRKLIKATGWHRFEPRAMRLTPGITRRTLLISLPNGLQQTMVGLSNVIVQAYVNLNGADVMAAFNAYLRLDGLVFLPLISLSMAITVFTGQNIGARQPERFRKGVSQSLWVGLAYAVAASMIVRAAIRPLLYMFTTEAPIIEYGALIAEDLLPFYFCFAMIFILRGAVDGSGHTLATMAISIANFCLLRVVILHYGGEYFSGVRLITASYVITWITMALCVVAYYIWGRWRRELRLPATETQEG